MFLSFILTRRVQERQFDKFIVFKLLERNTETIVSVKRQLDHAEQQYCASYSYTMNLYVCSSTTLCPQNMCTFLSFE